MGYGRAQRLATVGFPTSVTTLPIQNQPMAVEKVLVSSSDSSGPVASSTITTCSQGTLTYWQGGMTLVLLPRVSRETTSLGTLACMDQSTAAPPSRVVHAPVYKSVRIPKLRAAIAITFLPSVAAKNTSTMAVLPYEIGTPLDSRDTLKTRAVRPYAGVLRKLPKVFRVSSHHPSLS